LRSFPKEAAPVERRYTSAAKKERESKKWRGNLKATIHRKPKKHCKRFQFGRNYKIEPELKSD
jgi:hypothetical protein